MGCVFSKTDINDVHPTVFQAYTLNNDGNKKDRIILEVTKTDIILYENCVITKKWPLKSLRRYGGTSNLFSFEAGRRCPIGPGIFTYYCSRAEKLVKVLQTQIQKNCESDSTNLRDSTISDSSNHNEQMTADYLDPIPFGHNYKKFKLFNGPARTQSVEGNSNGPLSPPGSGISPLPSPSFLDNNDEVFSTVNLSRSFFNDTNKMSAPLKVPVENAPSTIPSKKVPSENPSLPLVKYAPILKNITSSEDLTVMNITPTSISENIFNDIPTSEKKIEYISSADINNFSFSKSTKVKYENIFIQKENNKVAKDIPIRLTIPYDEKLLECKNSYENLKPGEILNHLESMIKKDKPKPLSLEFYTTQTIVVKSAAPIPNVPQSLLEPPKPPAINYIEVDLEILSRSENGPPSPMSSSISTDLTPPDPPSKYAKIDFDRTKALSSIKIDSDRNKALCTTLQPLPESDSERTTRHNCAVPLEQYIAENAASKQIAVSNQ